MSAHEMESVYRRRRSRGLKDRLVRLLAPPAPWVRNPREPLEFAFGRWNLYLGGAGTVPPEGYINVDLLPMAGVDVAADVEALPFASAVFGRIECDAVLEHVRCAEQAMREIGRVLAPGGYLHIVTPFCHPYHAYPEDYRRFTLEGLKQLACGMEVIAEGWRTGPTATVLVFAIEYAKLLLPWRWWRVLAHGVLGWVLFPLRYLDLLLLRMPAAGRLGNHGYLWVRKTGVEGR